jgi:hypothetical protein
MLACPGIVCGGGGMGGVYFDVEFEAPAGGGVNWGGGNAGGGGAVTVEPPKGMLRSVDGVGATGGKSAVLVVAAGVVFTPLVVRSREPGTAGLVSTELLLAPCVVPAVGNC